MDEEETRHLAGYLLGQLLQKDSSVEVGVRGVLRIASLQHHAVWIAWAALQLVDMADESGLAEARTAIEKTFSDSDTQDRIIQQAKESYDFTRASVGNPTPNHSDIGDLERDVAIFETELKREITETRFHQVTERHRILNRVKNSVQKYLMMVEAGKKPSEPESQQ